MPHYQELLEELESFSDVSYRDFHKRLLKNENINVLGVRIPVLRSVAKKYKSCVDKLLTFPDEYYEVTFVKLTAVSLLKYGDFIKCVDICIPLIDNWATCDCFTPKCIAKHKNDFLVFVRKYLSVDKEFYQRFALTTLLHFYVEEEYLDLIFGYVTEADNEKFYYVHMASAWLIAETLAKFFDRAKDFLSRETLDKKTHNKSIQKACESFRLTPEQKNILKGMKK